MTTERGGILSKIIIIPAGVVLMVGFFFLGYHTGKYKSRSMATRDVASSLPDLASSVGQKQEEFTFYKTLSGNNDKMVSINLKPERAREGADEGKQQGASEIQKTAPVRSATKRAPSEIKIEKEDFLPVKPKQAQVKLPEPPAKREPPASLTDTNLRYTVQTAAYQEKKMAEEDVKRLKKRGYAAFITSTELAGNGMWHRVRLGSFTKKAAAEKLQRTLQAKEGISPIVVVE